jgi:holo-[acyl-carrier protein] synthase
MIIGIGCDVIEVDRIRQAIRRRGQPLIERLYTPREIEYCESYQDPFSRFAGRFVAKEALVKALGCGIGAGCSWLDIEILNESNGKPYVAWNLDVSTRFGIVKTHLSISHTASIAIAYAVLESE